MEKTYKLKINKKMKQLFWTYLMDWRIEYLSEPKNANEEIIKPKDYNINEYFEIKIFLVKDSIIPEYFEIYQKSLNEKLITIEFNDFFKDIELEISGYEEVEFTLFDLHPELFE